MFEILRLVQDFDETLVKNIKERASDETIFVSLGGGLDCGDDLLAIGLPAAMFLP